MFTIYPYKFKGSWVFDDQKRGLDKEAFVQGADKILDIISRGIPNAQDGFEVTFSADYFENAPYRITFLHPEFGGNWYRLDGYDVHGWLCPALFKFFPQAPPKIYIMVGRECLTNILINKFTKVFSRKKPNVMST